MNEFLEILKKSDVGKIEEEVLLSKHTTYKVGGKASLIVYPKDLKKLIVLLKLCQGHKIRYKVLGNGSNTLFSDRLFRGVIIKLTAFDKIKFFKNSLNVGAGVSLMKVANMAVRKGLSGLEFATGIPGTIGGAVFMNAGAYKSDMGYVVKKCKVLTPDFRVINMTNRELNFHYRSSFFQKNPNYICLEASIDLKKGDVSEMIDLVKDRRTRRMNSQPLDFPSAGSVFRNPSADMPAGKLIDDLGLKGLCRGGAKISDKHANFIININNAKASDVMELIVFAKEAVKDKYNIDLKVEQEFVNWEQDV